MSRCPAAPRKRRNPKGRGKSNGYAHSMKGHSWKRLFNKDNEHIGRECRLCHKKILNARGVIYERIGK